MFYMAEEARPMAAMSKEVAMFYMAEEVLSTVGKWVLFSVERIVAWPDPP